MIGTYFPQYASTTDEEKKEEVESPKLRSTGVYEYAVFVLTGESLRLCFHGLQSRLLQSVPKPPVASQRINLFFATSSLPSFLSPC